MYHRNRGLTITELLTVVAILTILTSMLSPFIITVKHAALGRACAKNLAECYVALQLVANTNYGKLPPCVELNTTDNPLKLTPPYGIKEDQWWYRRLSARLYIGKKPDGSSRDDPLAGGSVEAHQFVVRCPGSPDPYDQARVSAEGNRYQKVNTTDKDRAFDENFGYSNFGFQYGDGTSNQRAIPDPATLRWGAMGNSSYYRASGGWGAITGRPKHIFNQGTGKCDCGLAWPCLYTRIGEFASVPEAARTMLMMDYVKADVAPDLKNDGLRGYRFRHNGTANVLFVDGHIQVYTKREFLRDWAEPDHAQFARDPVTGRARIHWAVLRP